MRSGFLRLAAALGLLVTLSACALGGGDLKPIEEADVRTTYSLATGDRIRVTAFGYPDVSGEFEIDSDGTITYPLVGLVEAAGKSSSELKRDLTQLLAADYIVNPRVTIEVLTYRPFYILGEVASPGSYPYQAGMTVQQAIALSGGSTRRAVTSYVQVSRETGKETVKLRAGQDAKVLPGDTIRVLGRLF